MCREEKKSIATWFDGICFRSRLEARLAFILNKLEIEWVYEPDGFNLSNGLKYLPDFYLRFGDGTKQVLEAKGYLDDYDKAKIECFEKDFKIKVLMIDDFLKLHYYGEADEVFLDEKGMVSEMTEEFRKALDEAKKVVFEDYHRQLKSSCVKDDAASALTDLLVQYLDNNYSLELGEQPRIVNKVYHATSKAELPFTIVITKSDRKDFDVTWYCCDTVKFSVAVLERQVKKTCYTFWSISNNLWDEPDKSRWRTIKETRINNLVEFLRGDEQKNGEQ
jgi:hypothetical protein